MRKRSASGASRTALGPGCHEDCAGMSTLWLRQLEPTYTPWCPIGPVEEQNNKERPPPPLTLCKGLLNVSPYPGEGVLGRVGRAGAGRGRPHRHGDGPADGVAGGRARRACPLGLERQCDPLICFPKAPVRSQQQ